MWELFLDPVWVWHPESATRWDCIYRGFNGFEAVVWIGIAVGIVVRWYQYRRSWAEWIYSATFAAFGITDIVEAYAQSYPLILTKLFVLRILYQLRQYATRVWYPDARWY